MADRHFVMGQVFVADGTTTTDSAGRQVADKTITVTGGAGNFTIFMTEGITGTVTSGTATITGSPVTLSAGLNTLVADGNGDCTLDITIGTAANWNTVNNWSAASGGTGGASVPTSADNAYFDALSFTGAGQVVTVDAAAYCLDMDWTGATNNPTFSAITNSRTISLYGSLTFIADMTIAVPSGFVYFFFRGNCTLTLNGQSFPYATTIAAGTVTMTEDWIITGSNYPRLYISAGGLVTNNFTLQASFIIIDTAGAKTITPGSSTVNITGEGAGFDAGGSGWTYSGSNLTLTINTATINVAKGNGTGAFTGGGLTTYNIVNLTGATPTITGNNTIAALGLNPAGAQTITNTGYTQTVGSITRTGAGLITFVGGTYRKSGGGRLDRLYGSKYRFEQFKTPLHPSLLYKGY